MSKVYASPIPAPEVDYANFDLETVQADEKHYTEQVAEWLRSHGYHHKLTGKIVRLPWADGAAQYMVANGTTLIHLPLGDAWNVPEYMTRGLRATDLARLATDA